MVMPYSSMAAPHKLPCSAFKVGPQLSPINCSFQWVGETPKRISFARSLAPDWKKIKAQETRERSLAALPGCQYRPNYLYSLNLKPELAPPPAPGVESGPVAGRPKGLPEQA